MLELKRLRLLWELHARGTVAAVAAAMNYSPSAVSQQLATLEREAGVQLLRKSGRTLEITEAGLTLVAATDELLAGIERAEAAVQRIGSLAEGSLTGTLRVAAFQSALLTLMPGTLRRLRQNHPELRIEVVHYEPGAALRETWARNFDLVVAEEYPGHATPHYPGLDREALTRDPVRIGVPPSPSETERQVVFSGASDPQDWMFATKLSDLATAPWVMEPEGSATRHWAEQVCRSAGFEPDVRYETADLQAHLRLIETGNAVALLPGLVHAGQHVRVRLLDLPGEPHRNVFTAARESLEGHPALTAVRSALAAEATSLRYELPTLRYPRLYA